MNAKNLRTEHTFILRLLDHGELTVATLASANFGTMSQTRRLLEDLINLDLVERQWNGGVVKYKRK